jgi:hypothetical protein
VTRLILLPTLESPFEKLKAFSLLLNVFQSVAERAPVVVEFAIAIPNTPERLLYVRAQRTEREVRLIEFVTFPIFTGAMYEFGIFAHNVPFGVVYPVGIYAFTGIGVFCVPGVVGAEFSMISSLFHFGILGFDIKIHDPSLICMLHATLFCVLLKIIGLPVIGSI